MRHEEGEKLLEALKVNNGLTVVTHEISLRFLRNKNATFLL